MKGTPERGEGDGSSDSSSPAGEGQVSAAPGTLRVTASWLCLSWHKVHSLAVCSAQPSVAQPAFPGERKRARGIITTTPKG